MFHWVWAEASVGEFLGGVNVTCIKEDLVAGVEGQGG